MKAFHRRFNKGFVAYRDKIYKLCENTLSVCKELYCFVKKTYDNFKQIKVLILDYSNILIEHNVLGGVTLINNTISYVNSLSYFHVMLEGIPINGKFLFF